MKEFFEIPLIFWFLFCIGGQAIIQTSFLIKFSKLQTKVYYYIIFVGIAYLSYLLDMTVPLQQSFITQIINFLIGIGIIYVFSWKILKQDCVTSMIMGGLLITTNILVESLMTPLQSIAASVFSVSENANIIVAGAITLIATYAFLYFFSEKYNIKSNGNSQYLLILVIPMLFIGIVMRVLIEAKYFPLGVNYARLTHIILKENYEFLGLSVFAFICICGMLFAYEKVMFAFESEHRRKLLLNELDLQKSYVAEAKARYETTRIFRHDLKNHIITLRGMLEKNEINKAAKYLERFKGISDYVSFPISTGNMVIDIILSEKLSYAKAAGINIKYDITVPPTVNIDDFDLSVIFSNGIDNAIRACSHITNGEKVLDIVARQNKDFFVLDMINSFENGNVPSGTGLGLISIKIIVEKYHGAVEVVSENEVFRLSVLLPFEKN